MVNYLITHAGEYPKHLENAIQSSFMGGSIMSYEIVEEMVNLGYMRPMTKEEEIRYNCQ